MTRRALSCAVSTLAVLALVGSVYAQGQKGPLQTFDLSDGEEYVIVRYGPDTNLRSVAQEYLGDPDLWPIILRLNGFSDITEIEQDQELRLPANQLQAAISGLDTSLANIQAANEAGAQLFAPILIGRAISLRDDAVKEKQAGAYRESISLSTRSIDRAQSAQARSDELRDVEAEARLSDRHGRVEGQKTTENSWSDRALNAVLKEQEKLRTLSESTAQVVFRDASRLRLNPNSQAVIQRMRVDPLKKREEAQISLIEGDFYALLATESQRNRLEVSLPNADATIDSGSFWVSQDADAAKFSNYDTKPVSITARGETMVLGRNEGALVPTGEAPQEKVSVHDRIALDYPQDNAQLFGERVSLGWESGNDASQYWLEIALDARFDRMAESLWGVEDNRVEGLAIDPGVYFWRVAAIDAFGLPGQMSTVRRFEIRDDTTPPFLKILAPEPNVILRRAEVDVTGETEPDSTLTVNGEAAEIGPNGGFSHTVVAVDGANTVQVLARDSAGNKTLREVAFRYDKDERQRIAWNETLIRDDAGRFLSPGDTLTVSGMAAADAKIAVRDATGALRSETYSEPTGAFLINIPLLGEQELLTVQITEESGHAYEETIEALAITSAPKISYAVPWPAVTAHPQLEIEITSDQPAEVTVNGMAPKVVDGRMLAGVTLEQGPNLIETVATNDVGLVSIDKRTVIYDSERPVVTSQDMTLEQSGNAAMLSLDIGARDATGVAKTSRYRIHIAGQDIEGVLRYNKARRAYSGRVEVPQQATDVPITVEIEIADVAGNINLVKLVQ